MEGWKSSTTSQVEVVKSFEEWLVSYYHVVHLFSAFFAGGKRRARQATCLIQFTYVGVLDEIAQWADRTLLNS